MIEYTRKTVSRDDRFSNEERNIIMSDPFIPEEWKDDGTYEVARALFEFLEGEREEVDDSNGSRNEVS